MSRIALLVIFAVLLPAQSPPPSSKPAKSVHADKPQGHRDTTDTESGKTEANQISAAIDQLTTQIKTGAEKNELEQERRKSFADWWLKWGNLVLAGISAFAAVATVGLIAFQARVMHRQREAMDKQSVLMEKALAETAKAANAAKDSVTQASETAIRQLRAYVEVRQAGYMGLFDQSSFGVGFVFINHGQTPASRLNLDGIVDLLPYPLPHHFVLPAPPPRAPQDGVIFPGIPANPFTGWVWERGRPALTMKEKQTLFWKDSTQEVYAHGTVTYLDIFGIERKTKFCLVLNPHSVVRNEVGDIVHDQAGNVQFQWSPVANRNLVI